MMSRERYYPGKFIQEAHRAQKENGRMSRRAFLKASGELVVLSLVTSACGPFVRPTETPTTLPAVFDPESGIFIERSGGINEYVLNSLSNPGYRTPPMLDYLRRVDDQEHRLDFFPLGKYQALLSQMATILTTIENKTLVKALDRTESEVDEHHKRLKELIRRCNEIYRTTKGNSIERTMGIYEMVSPYLKAGKETDESVSILNLVNGNLGDCNDLVPAYFALFNYYHAKAYLVFGNVKGKTEKGERASGSHTWIRLEAGGTEFELDPTWYEPFVPLEIRNRAIDVIGFKKHLIEKGVYV